MKPWTIDFKTVRAEGQPIEDPVHQIEINGVQIAQSTAEHVVHFHAAAGHLIQVTVYDGAGRATVPGHMPIEVSGGSLTQPIRFDSTEAFVRLREAPLWQIRDFDDLFGRAHRSRSGFYLEGSVDTNGVLFLTKFQDDPEDHNAPAERCCRLVPTNLLLSDIETDGGETPDPHNGIVWYTTPPNGNSDEDVQFIEYAGVSSEKYPMLDGDIVIIGYPDGEPEDAIVYVQDRYVTGEPGAPRASNEPIRQGK